MNELTYTNGTVLEGLYSARIFMDIMKKGSGIFLPTIGEGITFCFATPGINLTSGFYYVRDFKGNNQLQMFWGGGVGNGAGASITYNKFYTNIPDIVENGDELGFNLGVSVGNGYAFGADVLILYIMDGLEAVE